MGYFDTIKVVSADPRIVCAHGHSIVEEFQTKDLGEGMSTYYIALGYFCSPQPSRTCVIPEMPPVLRTDLPLLPLLDEKRFEMYTLCRHCKPVYTRGEYQNWKTNSLLHPHQPEVSLLVSTERGTGKIVEVRPGSDHQTRDALRALLAKGGSALVADDDPEARAMDG